MINKLMGVLLLIAGLTCMFMSIFSINRSVSKPFKYDNDRYNNVGYDTVYIIDEEYDNLVKGVIKKNKERRERCK